jgi:methyltransferase (TIGR00027 family)
MAEGIALQRFAESMLPEDVRIFFDPYAVHFIDPVKLAWAKEHPREIQALMEDFEKKMPGWYNAIRGRIRYFDDIVQNAKGEGFSQLVILGAGYDTRAYRIDTLKGHTRVFEIDRPVTQERKTEIVKKIFGQLPDHVSFIPHEIGGRGGGLGAGVFPEQDALPHEES